MIDWLYENLGKLLLSAFGLAFGLILASLYIDFSRGQGPVIECPTTKEAGDG